MAACDLADEAFKGTLPNLISIGTGRGDMELGESLRLRCVSLLVSRYAKCRERPEHMALRDAAVSIVGNPWLRRANWDAWVVDARGKPDDQSREMVNGWLKRELIKNFFELLSVDGTGDSRRVDYWLRFEPSIDEMWFALGTDAQYRRGEAFTDFKSRAKGRLLDLDGTTADNNAFVMRVGRYLLVEFGAKGNAMFVFEWDSLGKPLLDTLTSGKARATIYIRTIRDSVNIERLIHRDSAAQTWSRNSTPRSCPVSAADPATRRVASARSAAFAQRRLRREHGHSSREPTACASRTTASRVAQILGAWCRAAQSCCRPA